MPNRTLRALLVSLVLAYGFYLLLWTTRGPIVTDGVMYFAPIIIGAMLAWYLLVFNRRRPYSFPSSAARQVECWGRWHGRWGSWWG